MLVKFEVYSDGEYWCARGIGEDIFTQGKTLDELMNNMKEAVEVHFTELLEKGERIEILSLSELEVKPSAKVAGSQWRATHQFLTDIGYEVVRQVVFQRVSPFKQ